MALKELSDYRIFNVGREMEKSLATLSGILEGIECDNIISEKEVTELRNWAELHKAAFYPEPLNSILYTVSEAIDDGVLTSEEFEDIRWACDRGMDKSNLFNPNTIAIQTLHGIMHGILADGIVSDTEIGYLLNWLQDFDFLKGSYPYDELDSLISSILADNIITADERNILKVFFADFIDTKSSANIDRSKIEQLKSQYQLCGICSMCPDITFDDHVFCFTGVSNHYKRNDIASKIEELGGTYIDSVSQNTDFLIIGNKGNPCFAYACYGRKIEKAVDMRKQGGKIILVHENDFWDTVVDRS